MAGGNNNVGIYHVFPMFLVKDWQKERKDTSMRSFGIIFWVPFLCDKIGSVLDSVLPKASYMKRKLVRFKLSVWLDYWLDLTERKPVQSVTNGIGAALGHIRHSQLNNLFLKEYFWKIPSQKYTYQKCSQSQTASELHQGPHQTFTTSKRRLTASHS